MNEPSPPQTRVRLRLTLAGLALIAGVVAAVIAISLARTVLG
jgi:hypothetical protein